MEFGRAFDYVFKDRSWISKVLIGGLLSLTFILLPSMVGYTVDTARQVRDDNDLPLPEWGEDFGGRWIRGLTLIIGTFVWGLVISLPVICLAMIFGLAAAGAGNNQAGAAEGVFAALGLILNCLSIPLSILGSLVAPAVYVQYINRGTFGSMFQVGEVIRHMSSDWNRYLLVFVLTLVAGFISGLGAIACGIGLIFTVPYAQLILAHLVGQLARERQGGTGGLSTGYIMDPR